MGDPNPKTRKRKPEPRMRKLGSRIPDPRIRELEFRNPETGTRHPEPILHSKLLSLKPGIRYPRPKIDTRKQGRGTEWGGGPARDETRNHLPKTKSDTRNQKNRFPKPKIDTRNRNLKPESRGDAVSGAAAKCAALTAESVLPTPYTLHPAL